MLKLNRKVRVGVKMSLGYWFYRMGGGSVFNFRVIRLCEYLSGIVYWLECCSVVGLVVGEYVFFWYVGHCCSVVGLVVYGFVYGLIVFI